MADDGLLHLNWLLEVSRNKAVSGICSKSAYLFHNWATLFFLFTQKETKNTIKKKGDCTAKSPRPFHATVWIDDSYPVLVMPGPRNTRIDITVSILWQLDHGSHHLYLLTPNIDSHNRLMIDALLYFVCKKP